MANPLMLSPSRIRDWLYGWASNPPGWTRRVTLWLGAAALAALLVGCGGRGEATRTPVPTFTPTPLGQGVPAPPAAGAQTPADPATATATALPPTPTFTPAATDTPTPVPTATVAPTPTDEPTATPVPTAVPTAALSFILETAEKHPTESLAPNVVRIFLYVYAEGGLGLPGYTLRIAHNGAELPVDQVSKAGLPGLTRGEPSPYTRFTNMNVIFVEAQAGTWTATLLNEQGEVVGPPAEFQLTAQEETRELYVRYRRK